MTQVKVDEIIDHVRSEVKKALQDAFDEVVPHADIDLDAFYAVFKKQVYHHCSIWENIPDRFVKVD